MTQRRPTLRPGLEGAAGLTQAVNQLLQGRINSFGFLTLVPDEAVTRVEHPSVGERSVVVLSPRSSAAALSLTAVHVVAERGAFTLHHPVSPLGDRQYGYVILGG